MSVRPTAVLDIEAASLFYLLEGSEAVSERFERSVKESLAWILENPSCGAPRRSFSPRLDGLRMWPVRGFENHLVFYRETEETVEVVRVLHGARDIEDIFQNE